MGLYGLLNYRKLDLHAEYYYICNATNIPNGILVSMQNIPDDIKKEFLSVLERRAVPVSSHVDYIKWLLYYLDYCIFLCIECMVGA